MSDESMMAKAAKQHNVASYVLRFTQDLYEDEDHDAHVRWRGDIRHVQGDESRRFTDFAEAVGFIQRGLADLTADTLAGTENMSQEKVFAESFKLWEQFASSYTDIMRSAMEQTLKQSELISKQVEAARAQALKAWQLPQSGGDNAELLSAVTALNEQVAALADRVAALEAALNAERDS